MAKFRIYARSITYLYVDVEAKDEEEAMEAYETIDGGDFHEEHGFGDFRLDAIEPINDDEDVDFIASELLYPEV